MEVLWLLFLLGVDMNSARSSLGESALQKSKHCVEAAKEAYTLLAKGNPNASTVRATISHLETLAEDGKYLKQSADKYLSKQESMLQGSIKILDELQAQKIQLEKEKTSANQNKMNLLRKQSAISTKLQDNQNKLNELQQEVQNAENDLNRAREEFNDRKEEFFGIPYKLGQVVGHAPAAEERFERAKINLDKKITERNEEQTAANIAQNALYASEQKLRLCQSKVQEIQQKIESKHTEITNTKKSLVLVRKSVRFWELFIVAASNAKERTSSLKKIVEIIEEEKEYHVMQQDGTITKAKSFVNAWEFFSSIHQIN